MFMFSILILQGFILYFEDVQKDTEASNSNPAQQRIIIDEIEYWYGSMGTCMFSLLCAVTGGRDWLDIRAPISHAGHLYSAAFVVYVLFVCVGVINILTGVFVQAAGDENDQSLVVLNEQARVERFVKQMMEVFNDMANEAGKIDLQRFKKALGDERVQAFLAIHELGPKHAMFIFDLLDAKRKGILEVGEIVSGLLRWKGNAKAVDARVLQRQVGMLPKLINSQFKAVARTEM
mmetsp:Transcript_85181/g.150432  ORF Transcript_85181/g.150432 Transcript_85181/m.150432 type:complete len:234 (-) Transcript_85181:27-728(-)